MDNFTVSQSKFTTMVDNSFKFKKLPHAMLIEGNSTYALDKAVNYICTKLISEDHSFDESIYQRVLNHQVADIIQYDLSDVKLKKENVLDIRQRFSQTALEESNVQIYVIKYVEEASSIVLNTLLKFVEEPTENIYAIFTTHNAQKVLGTIVSRCMLYRLANNDIDKVKEIYYQSFPKDDVDLVSTISKDEVIIENILKSEGFTMFKDNANRIFTSLVEGNYYLTTHELLDQFSKDQLDDVKIYFELFYTSISNPDFLQGYGLSQDTISQILSHDRYETLLDAVLGARVQLETNMNKDLIVDEFAIRCEGIK